MTNFVTRLDDFGVIETGGADATAFLHGQLSSDILSLTDQQSQFSAWCNAQGRVICTLLVIRDQDRYLLLLPKDLVETVSQRLKMFVLRAKVTISNLSQKMVCLGISGAESETIAATMSLTANASKPVIKAIIRHSNEPRIILIIPTDSTSLDSSLTATAYPLTDKSAWQLADIQDGIPWITTPTSGELMPAELNLERLDGLSYNKGCYPGQEIIARLHFRGKLKRRLCQAYIDSQHIVLPAGARLHTGAEPVLAGTVIACVHDSGHRMRLLAVIDMEITGTRSVFTENQEPVLFTPLPDPVKAG